MANRISIGPEGEFFIESNEALTAEQLPIIDQLYRMILTARMETVIVRQAMDDREGQ